MQKLCLQGLSMGVSRTLTKLNRSDLFQTLSTSLKNKNFSTPLNRLNLFEQDAKQKLKYFNELELQHHHYQYGEKQMTGAKIGKRLLENDTMTNKVCIVDFAGTITRDSIWPAEAMCQVFKETGNIIITLDEARGPMGLKKLDHIIQLLQMARISKEWQNKHNNFLPTRDDAFILLSAYEKLPVHDDSINDLLLPNLISTMNQLRQMNYLFGLTTGYDRMLANKFLIPAQKKCGLNFNSTVTSDEVKSPRPAPDGIYKNLANLNLLSSIDNDYQNENNFIIKVDDTCPGIEEGKNANAFTIGVWATSSYMNFDFQSQPDNLDPISWEIRKQKAITKLNSSRPHIIVPTFHYVPLIARIINFHKNYNPSL